MEHILLSSNIKFEQGKIKIPSNCTKVSIDVGLSLNALQSEQWLSKDPNLFVIGFEPVKFNIESILNGYLKPSLNLKYLNKRFILIPCALSNENNLEGVSMYVTPDKGTSSLLLPKYFEVEHIEKVSVVTLESFLSSFFPFDRFPMIQHLKIDTQGSDFNVLLGAGNFISKFLAITVEIDNYAYHDTINNPAKIRRYLARQGFFQYNMEKGKRIRNINNFILNLRRSKIKVNTKDPTFLNRSLIKKYKKENFNIFQD